jgi:hypothetical protein
LPFRIEVRSLERLDPWGVEVRGIAIYPLPPKGHALALAKLDVLSLELHPLRAATR